MTSDLSRETRLQIMLDADELAAIDDWRFKHRMPSRAAAIRQLIGIGLRAVGPTHANSTQRSRDFGILSTRNGDAQDLDQAD